MVTPVVDYALSRDDVDPERIAIYGASMGGYMVARAAAFEHRIAAAITDLGVWDVATPTDSPSRGSSADRRSAAGVLRSTRSRPPAATKGSHDWLVAIAVARLRR